MTRCSEPIVVHEQWNQDQGLAWHAVTPDHALERLQSHRDGLSEAEAATRIERVGSNEIREQKAVSPAAILLRQVASPLIYILVIAGIVSAAVGEYIDASFIGLVIAVNAVVGFIQEYRAEQSVAALRRLATTRARVLRGGREHEIDSRLLVPGDIVSIESGMRVAADARILSSQALEADESLLTGESAPVGKSAAPVATESSLADRTSMLYMGSVITRGRGRSLIVATGSETEIGAISGSLAAIESVQAPVQRRMGRFARVVAVVAFAVFLLGLAIGLARGESLHELFFTLVALTVSAIPEGLPVVLTVTLAVGVSRMAGRNVIVRRLPAVETLGSCTVIGSDKTGTLTQNRMTVAGDLRRRARVRRCRQRIRVGRRHPRR